MHKGGATRDEPSGSVQSNCEQHCVEVSLTASLDRNHTVRDTAFASLTHARRAKPEAPAQHPLWSRGRGRSLTTPLWRSCRAQTCGDLTAAEPCTESRSLALPLRCFLVEPFSKVLEQSLEWMIKVAPAPPDPAGMISTAGVARAGVSLTVFDGRWAVAVTCQDAAFFSQI